ncbi:transcription-repair coupling factor [Prochlorococcus sp. MIT 1307]|uniref:transcription-repair coupling factor n=1 Tax=Prochlorococcus sp. MIT 1307 TaxID=3096219 RepID=UPI002A7594D0|nr:transcription-repair coupling factor [Prochlorococcus sp. MIT 1307]
MPLESVMLQLQKSIITEELIERTSRSNRLLLSGASRAVRALISSAIAKSKSKPLLVIVPTLEEASRWFSLLQLIGWKTNHIYPTSEGSPYESNETSSEIIWGQLQVLSDLHSSYKNSSLAIVATERSLQPHLPPSKELLSCFLTIKKGDEIDLENLSLELSKLGYNRLNTIDQEGSWARRGDIIDVYPVSNELPVRLELFGEEVDKLREFDPITQKSLQEINDICLTPTNFNTLIADQLRKEFPCELEQLLDDEILEEILEGNSPKGLRKVMGLAWDEPSSLLDYISTETCIVVDEKDQCIAHGNQWLSYTRDSFNELISSKINKSIDSKVKYSGRMHRDINSNFELINKFSGFDLSELNESVGHTNSFDLSNRSISFVPNQFSKISEQIKKFTKEKYLVWILSAQPSRTVTLLEEHDCTVQYIPNNKDQQAISRLLEQRTPVALKISSNSDIEGLVMPAWKIVILTDKEFFGQQSILSTGYIRRRRAAESIAVNPNKMKAGDYVVHRNHGIGQFLKLEKHAISGEIRDYLVVQYSDGTLSVAADQLGSLGRYRATDGKKPKINKMGGSAWLKVKERAKKHLKKVAFDLVKLYAERSKAEGFAFPKDGPWQTELEDSFPYEPTTDQKKAVFEVKKDMERKQPMDRLVCGDVGFGKTEVAVRAIFKAITAGKQVALLAPTTVLAQQHWRTISERFAPYPIKVSLLNRFRSNAEKKVIISELNDGKIDALIGTHQVLSTKIKFKGLGLLVIDEEQRFGVNQKEKIKNLKKDVDVLTLSATPIPRTLYMSLSGIREMSLITTPPPLRRPIKTHLSPYNDEAIRSAICQELDRGGQIFYVVPRVEGINDVAERLKKMVPKLNLLVAHGQMDEGELENSMVAFNSGEADLMLCTTIIESGLDIPRVNTILIEDGHKFGLSQLYQLRGRVGRSGIQAHAWIFYPSSSALNDSSRQRLRAIQEFAELGSGYQLAMRDMEIRGVGNLLGVEQSGQMEVIGFDLYMELLQEALSEIQGQDIPIVEETQIDLTLTAFIPSDWIVNNDEKIAAYRLATECNSSESLVELATTWSDRYGQLPGPVETLLDLMKLKLLTKKTGFSRVKQENNNLVLETTMQEPAFMLLRKGLPKHLQTRLIYQNTGSNQSRVVARGLGILTVDKQLDQLVEWITLMNDQIPDSSGFNKQQKINNIRERDDDVISL